MSYILGLSAFYHDSAACLVHDGRIVAAAQEERFTRVKGDENFPERAAHWCLTSAGITASDLDAVAFYDKPLLKFDRLLESWLYTAPRGLRAFLQAAPLWAGPRLQLERAIRDGLGGYEGRILWCEHHESHAASAFYPSPYREAAVLTVDGVGEWATASIGVGKGAELRLLFEQHFPDSLGLLYSAFTYHAGFRVNSGEYKLMGLAPYGEPRFADAIRTELMDLREDGSFTLNQRYFNYLSGLTMTNDAFSALFGGPPRVPETPLTQREMDLARSVQEVTEEVVLRMARTARRETGCDSLCMAGGVALNAVANGRILRDRVVERLWVQPAAGDAGGAVGAALLAWHRWFGGDRETRDTLACAPMPDDMSGALLGPSFAPDAAAAALDALGARYHDQGREGALQRAAALLAEGKVIGFFDGPMEFGPRALGARSILADPRNPRMQAELNLKIKFREGFRPFAPVVLAERAREYFDVPDGADASPYMLVVVPVRDERRREMSEEDRRKWGIDLLNVPRSDLPAVTHVDFSARLQTVHADRTAGLHAVLSEFNALTGCPVLVNTSFNVRGEPIVCTPEDAYACFMRTGLDALVIPPYVMLKQEQPETDRERWQTPIAPD